MIKKLKNITIRTKLLLLILFTGIICYSLFQFLWYNKWTVYELINPLFNLAPPYGNEYIYDHLTEEATKYDIPESEYDTEAVEKLQPFFDLTDQYTSIYIYGLDGYYRAGKYASAMDDNTFRTVFDLGYRITGGEGEGTREFSLEFKNGTALVMMYFYHTTMFLYPYAIFCTVTCTLLFLSVILFFISRKMKQIYRIKD
ncbi:MAG: sensor histidine kinase, partial [Agathobacter sp.]|nr:sensor histidine kinase [Agathobacter sp.]